MRRTRGTDGWCHDIWQIADAGDQGLLPTIHYRSKRIPSQICDIVRVAVKASARKRQHAWMRETEEQRTMPTSMSVGLLCCWPGNLELSTGQPQWPELSSDSFRRSCLRCLRCMQRIQRSRDNFCDVALYKCTIDIDIVGHSPHTVLD